MRETPAQPRSLPSILSSRGALTLVLLGAFLLSLTAVDWSGAVHPGGWAALGQIIGSLFHPDLSSDVLGRGVAAAWRTLAYSVTGITLALAIGIPLGIISSGTLPLGGRASRGVAVAARAFAGFLRAIHELVWAWLFVVALGLTPLAAVVALGLPYGGILARNISEQLNDVPEAPLRSLRGSGASEWKTLLYGRLPMALPDVTSYGLYRWECAIRSAAIMSFIGLGGLGFEVRIALDDLHYSQVWTYLLMLMGLVLIVDVWSSLIRRRITQ